MTIILGLLGFSFCLKYLSNPSQFDWLNYHLYPSIYSTHPRGCLIGTNSMYEKSIHQFNPVLTYTQLIKRLWLVKSENWMTFIHFPFSSHQTLLWLIYTDLSSPLPAWSFHSQCNPANLGHYYHCLGLLQHSSKSFFLSLFFWLTSKPSSPLWIGWSY